MHTSSDKREAMDGNCLTKTMAPKGVPFSLTNLRLIKGKWTKNVVQITLCTQHVPLVSCFSYGVGTYIQRQWYGIIVHRLYSIQSTMCGFLYGDTKKCWEVAKHPEICKQHFFHCPENASVQLCSQNTTVTKNVGPGPLSPVRFEMTCIC